MKIMAEKRSLKMGKFRVGSISYLLIFSRSSPNLILGARKFCAIFQRKKCLIFPSESEYLFTNFFHVYFRVVLVGNTCSQHPSETKLKAVLDFVSLLTISLKNERINPMYGSPSISADLKAEIDGRYRNPSLDAQAAV